MQTTKDFTNKSNKHRPLPLNYYNIFFALERQRLIQENGSCGTAAVHQHKDVSSFDLAGYDHITLPDPPPRYQNLNMPRGWFVPGKKTKRRHVRSQNGGEFDVHNIHYRLCTFRAE